MSVQLTEEETLRRALVAEKHSQAKIQLRAQGVDLWLIFAREGSDQLLPYVLGNEEIVGTTAIMIFAEGPSVAICADYDARQFDGIVDIVHPYSNDWREDFLKVLKDRNPNRIAINYSENDEGVDGLTHGLYLRLVNTLTPAGLVDRLVCAEPIAQRVRSIKSGSEIERLKRACEITIRIFDDLDGMLKVGMTEFNVWEILHERMDTYGVTPSWESETCPGVFTSRTTAGHARPGLVKVEPGDTLRVDFGVKYEGYGSDLQRTWYFPREGETEVPAEITRAFNAVRDAIQIAFDALKPGMHGHEIDTPARGHLASLGYGYTHALGHQIGRKCHDGGVLLGPRNERYGSRSAGTIEAGMVFTLEPVCAMIALEEDVVVTETGAEWLVPPQREIYIVR